MSSVCIASETSQRSPSFKKIRFQEYNFYIKDRNNNNINNNDNIEYYNCSTSELMAKYLKSEQVSGKNILDIGSGIIDNDNYNQSLCGLLAVKLGANVIFTSSNPPESIFKSFDETIKLNKFSSLMCQIIFFKYGLENLTSFYNMYSTPLHYIIGNNILSTQQFKSVENVLQLFTTISSMLKIQKYHYPTSFNCKCVFTISTLDFDKGNTIPFLKILEIANKFGLHYKRIYQESNSQLWEFNIL